MYMVRLYIYKYLFACLVKMSGVALDKLSLIYGT